MYYVYEGDLPSDVEFSGSIAIDTETLGLVAKRDRLCLVQISDGSGNSHMVHFSNATYNAPNLVRVLGNNDILKLFHFARFDMLAVATYLDVKMRNIYCTKIASKIALTYTDRHGLASICRDLLGVDLDKRQQTTDWAKYPLSQAQKEYAASDVIYLHALKNELDKLLQREHRLQLAYECFQFLPTQLELDLFGWPQEYNIFAHAS